MLAANNGQLAHAGSGIYSSGEPLAVAFNASLATQDALLMADLDPRGGQDDLDPQGGQDDLDPWGGQDLADGMDLGEEVSLCDDCGGNFSLESRACSLQRTGDVNDGR